MKIAIVSRSSPYKTFLQEKVLKCGYQIVKNPEKAEIVLLDDPRGGEVSKMAERTKAKIIVTVAGSVQSFMYQFYEEGASDIVSRFQGKNDKNADVEILKVLQ